MIFFGYLVPCTGEETPELANIERLEAEVAEHPDDLDLRYELGLAYNDYAMVSEEDANEEALEKASLIFEQIYVQDPSRLEAKAMLGSATVLRARFASIFTKIRWAERGFDILDTTLMEDPNNANVRLIRAANSAQVPKFLRRGGAADEDFAWLLAEMDRVPESYEDGFRRSVYFYAGEYALKKDDQSAVELLLKAQATPGEERLDHQISETLEEARKRFPESFSPSES